MTISTHEALDLSLLRRRGAERLVSMTLRPPPGIARFVYQRSPSNRGKCGWSRLGTAKRIPDGHAARAEDILTGPVPVLRYLHLMHQTLDDISRFGSTAIAQGRDFRLMADLRVPVFPTKQLFDRSAIWPHHRSCPPARGCLESDSLFGSQLDRVQGMLDESPQVCLVLGAGNVSSIPDHRCADQDIPVQPGRPAENKPGERIHWSNLRRSLCSAHRCGPASHNLWRWRYWRSVDRIGRRRSCSHHWFRSYPRCHRLGLDTRRTDRGAKQASTPRLTKPITSELGNVSPWLVVPGKIHRSAIAIPGRKHRGVRFPTTLRSTASPRKC